MRLPPISLLTVSLLVTINVTAEPVIPDDPAVTITAPHIALINARIIDGLGRPARENQQILLAEGRVKNIGADIKIPHDTEIIDLAGKTVLPGLVLAHEHSFYS